MLLLAACSDRSNEVQVDFEATHPNRASLEAFSDAVPTSYGPASSELERMRARLDSAVLVDSFGSLDGPTDEILGLITSVAVSPTTGQIAVVDPMASRVVLLDSMLEVRFSVGGRAGGGPEDLQSPTTATPLAEDVVQIADASLGVKRLRRDPSGGAELVERVEFIPTNGICIRADGSYVAPFARETAPGSGFLQAGRIDGGTARRFGPEYDDDSPLVRNSMSEGHVSCDRSDRVFAARSWLPFVHRFNADGSMRWTARLMPFEVGTFRWFPAEGRNPGFGLDIEGGPAAFVFRITELSPDVLAVQVGVRTLLGAKRREFFSRIETFLLDAATGEGVHIGDELPVIAAVSGSRMIAFRLEPFPQILSYRLPD